MNYLLFGGQPKSGKTSAITRLTTALIAAPFSFSIYSGTFPLKPGGDFTLLLERATRGINEYIIINSPSDDKLCIDNLKEFYDNHSSKNIIAIISSVRDINWERDYFFSTLKIRPTGTNVFEIPLARITRRTLTGNFPLAIAWYEATIDRHINLVLTNPPFSL